MPHFYKIHYGWNTTARLWTPAPPEATISRFCHLANQCFGIRKSITREPVILEHREEDLPDPWSRLKGAHEVLIHNPPIEDTIVWNAKGKKIRDEWD